MAANTILWLSQIQFFISLGFMAVFAAMGLGLSWLLLFFRLRSLGGQAQGAWLGAYRFWVRVFALALVLALAGGIAVLIQLASLWPGLFERISAVSSPLLAIALVCAFVFKSCFLGAMLFAERRLSDRVHAFTVLMVAVGLTLTAACLLALFSWMQAPAGTVLLDGQFWVHDWRLVLFSPSFAWHAGLFLAACLLCAAFLVIAVAAWQGRWHPPDDSERHAFRSALVMGTAGLVLLTALLPGTGGMIATHQPAKAAAAAALWQSGAQADLLLFAVPQADNQSNRAVLALPGMGGRWLGRDDQGRLRGLDQFSGMHPPVAAVFFSVRGAWLAGGLMLLSVVYLWLRRLAGRMPSAGFPAWERCWLVAMGWSGPLLLLCGMAYLLFGAYPYAVYGSVTLDEIMAPSESPWRLAGVAAYLLLYGLFSAAFVAMIRHVARYGVVPVTRHRGRA